MPIAVAAAVFLALGAASATPMATPDAAVRAIFASYAIPDTSPASGKASWDYPVYSRATTALIRQWRKVVPEDAVDDLDDGDWLCQCQDWEASAFRATVLSRHAISPDLLELSVVVAISREERRKERLVLRHEGGRWVLDDLFADSFPQGLKQALRETIVRDIRARR